MIENPMKKGLGRGLSSQIGDSLKKIESNNETFFLINGDEVNRRYEI